MSFFNNGNESGKKAPRVAPERAAALQALMTVLTFEAVTNQDAAWLGLLNVVPNPFSYSMELLDLHKNRIQAYLDLQAHIFPFNGDRGIIFVDDVPELELVQAFMVSGIPCYGAEWDEEQGLVGVEYKAPYTQLYFDDMGISHTVTDDQGRCPLWEIPPYNEELHGKPSEFLLVGEQYQGCCPLVRPMAFYQVSHLVKIMEGKNANDVAAFVAGVTGMTQKEPGVVTLEPSYGNTLAWSEVRFDFVHKVISTGREFPQRLESFITNVGAISVEISMALQAIEIAGIDGETSQRQIDAMLAARTQVFEEEDLYGARMFADEQLRTIREHSIALLDVEGNSEFPYYGLIDNNNPEGVSQCINWLISQDRQFFPDKNGMKRVVCDQGVTALMLGIVGDTGVFVTDVQKPKKTLNRNWQAVAIRAMEGLPGSEGYRPYRGSALRVMDRRYPAAD
jgi:hypothetical protein